jgi:hypothetical protein
MKSKNELTEQELNRIETLSKKYDIPYEEVRLNYCFFPSDSQFEHLEKEYKLRSRYRKMGINDLSTVREIENKLGKINFYTRTIEALIKVGWSPCGTDGVIVGFHNDRAKLINEIEAMNDHLLLVKRNKNNKGPFKICGRREYLAKHNI